MEPASPGLLFDLLWSDPVPNFERETEPSPYSSLIPRGQLFAHNTKRGSSFYFTYGWSFILDQPFLLAMHSYEAVIKFLQRNNLKGIIRGHEAPDAGYVVQPSGSSFIR
jgi:serine/threonine-protein phosphatase 2B catalytic subunit